MAKKNTSSLDSINNLSLPAVILIGCVVLGSFYYATQASKQKSIEKQQQIKIEQEKQEQDSKKTEQETKELKEKEAKEKAQQALTACITDAENSYLSHWFRECKARGLLTDRCISLEDMTFDEYVKQENISQNDRLDAVDDYYNEKEDCSCSLPTYLADSIGENRDKLKDVCLERYPQL